MKIRDKEAFILFVAGTALSFFIVMNGIQLLNAWFTQMTMGMEEQGFQNSVVLNMFDVDREYLDSLEGQMDADLFQEIFQKQYQEQKENASILLNILAEQEGDAVIYLWDLYLPVGANAEREPVNIILSGREDWYRSLETGAYPPAADWQGKGRQAVISEAAKKYVELREGRQVIQINGEDYQVLGVFQNYQISEGDVEICIYYDSKEEIAQLVQHELAWAFQMPAERHICVGSNQGEVREIAEELKTELEEALEDVPISLSEYESHTGNGMDKFYARIKATVLVVVFLVSLLNVRQITRLWITRKKQELVIQKTFGMEDRQIIGRLLRELLQMLVCTFVVILCLSVFYSSIVQSAGMEWRLALQNGGLLLGAFLIIIAVTLIPILQGVRQVVPAQGLRGE
ncbi:MAG: hypothetical protein K2N24_09235 [Lachnospiraceae bacterium]|nr:hypothetical protein [Lachnospiraceae bacterium]